MYTFKHNVNILDDYQNYTKSYTSLKFWLKNVLNLWSWAPYYEKNSKLHILISTSNKI